MVTDVLDALKLAAALGQLVTNLIAAGKLTPEQQAEAERLLADVKARRADAENRWAALAPKG